MRRQRVLDFRREGFGTLWNRLPVPWRREVIAIYARLIARAAQGRRRAHQREDHSND